MLGIFDAKVGGASGECLGAVQLWRKHGLDVDLIPTWGTPTAETMAVCDKLGCKVHLVRAHQLASIPGLPGATVVSFCNDNAFQAKRKLTQMGCRHVMAPLMCFLTVAMRNALSLQQVSDVVFQSKYQRSRLEPTLKSFGYTDDRLHTVRGYIDWPAVKLDPLPHKPETPFVIGRAARPRASKWHPAWWKMYERVPDREAVLLGVAEATVQQIGRAPKWATIHKPGEFPADVFWQQLHAHVTCNASDMENWPRTGLEAMMYGVPTCAENRYGWTEMLEHGVTGMLGDTPESIGDNAARLSQDEELRMSIVTTARRKLETEISNPDLIWEQWKKVLQC